jgi:MscS family membrane protein
LSHRLLAPLLAAIALLAMAAPLVAAEGEPENPLEPLDASSPRATIESFIEQTAVTEEAALTYRRERSLDAQQAYFEEVEQTRNLFDLSEVPAASQAEVVEESFLALADILLRIPPPDAESMPDAEMVAADELTQWTLPGTEITLRTLEEGDRAGSWVFTPRTVANLPGWRNEVEDLPVLAEDRAITDWRQNSDISTGPLVPAAFVDALPGFSKERLLGSPLWKTFFALLGGVLVVLLTALWYRWIGRRGPDGTIRKHVLGATTPLFLFGLIGIYQWYMSSQVNPSGELAEFIVAVTTITFWLAVAWLFYELAQVLTEWMIRTPRLSDKTYDPHLIRLVARVVSVLGVGLIILFGANQIGIPALGLLAGASVIGLAVGLAAQPTLENFIGGMTLFADKPFQIGDYVRFGADDGTVEEIGARSTRIRKLDGTLLTVPNSDIVQDRIANSSKRDNALFLHTVGVRYETTMEQVETLVERIREGLRRHPKVEEDENLPRVRLVGFGPSSIDIEARAYVDTTSIHEFMAVQEELLTMIMRSVEAIGTSMAFPSTTAYVTRDEGIPGPVALAKAEASEAPAEAGPTEPSSTTTAAEVDENLEVDPSPADEDEH